MNVQPDHPLFRPEVAQARQQRLAGEIVLAQPLGAQAIALLLFAIVAAVGLWLSLGEYARTESVRGILVTDDASAKVIAVRPGRLTELAVREGDLVTAGQKIAVIQTEQSNEAGASAIGESLAAISAQELLALQQADLAGQRERSERARLDATLASLRQQRADLTSQIELQKEMVASAQDLFERIQTIVEKGFVSQTEVERRRQAFLSTRQQLAGLNQQLNAIGGEEARANAELARIAADGSSAVAQAQTAGHVLVQQRAQISSDRAYVVTAPIAGRITVVQAAPGRVVDGSVPLMTIVPEGSRLHADIYAPTRAIGFVKPGQEVRLLYDAFPYQRFGSHPARITRVSRMVIDPRELSAPIKVEEPVYRIEVVPDAQTVNAFGQTLPLQPGMTLTANIVLDRRSFLDWLLAPLNAVLRRNG